MSANVNNTPPITYGLYPSLLYTWAHPQSTHKFLALPAAFFQKAKTSRLNRHWKISYSVTFTALNICFVLVSCDVFEGCHSSPVTSSRLDDLGVFSDSAYWMHTLAASQLCFVIWLHYVFYAVTSTQNKQASSGCARWWKKQYPRQVSDLDDLGTGHRGLPDSAPVDKGWYSLISFKKN